MRGGLAKAYSGLGYLIAALVVVQFFLAGLGMFGASDFVDFDTHATVGGILHGLTLLLFLLAIAGPRNGRDIGMGLVLVLITTLQIYLPETRDDAPAIAAFHPLLALVVMGLAAHIGERYLGRGRGSAAPA